MAFLDFVHSSDTLHLRQSLVQSKRPVLHDLCYTIINDDKAYIYKIRNGRLAITEDSFRVRFRTTLSS